MAWYQLPLSLVLLGTAMLAQADIWNDYLQPMSRWPKSAEPSGKDLAALPPALQLNKHQIDLGRRLFFDANLSRDKTVSCGSCHLEAYAFGDNKTLSPGVHGRIGTRNSPTLVNVALWNSFFWDSRSSTLSEQILGPLTSPFEMDSTPEIAQQRVSSDPSYRSLFNAAFGTPDISWEKISIAIITFEKSIREEPTTFDLWIAAIKAKDYQSAKSLYTTQQLTGLHLFRTKAGCIRCHNGPLLSDQKTHVTGLHMIGRKFEDLGRWDATNEVTDLGAFRTPTLRYVSRTGPWMHNGLFPSLKGIINFYAHGGARPKPRKDQIGKPFPKISDQLVPFKMTRKERDSIVSFLKTI